MTIAVWKTGHEIADTVADVLARGVCYDQGRAETWTSNEDSERNEHLNYWRNGRPVDIEDTHIGYGILRGMKEVFEIANQRNEKWFNVDRGYFKPGHFDGYYRISYKGTQQTANLDTLEPDYERFDKLGIELKPWRGFARNKPVLIIPPTEYVQNFFCLEKDQNKWFTSLQYGPCSNGVIRTKIDNSPIIYDDYSHVVTFNSSVGWQALAEGIPCVSDPTHSIVGKWFANIPLADLAHAQYKDRHKLFAIMGRLQLTLKEIREGHLCPLLSQLISTSDGIPENPLQAMSLHTAS